MNNYKKLETHIKSLEKKKKTKEEIIKKAQDEIKEYNKKLKELYAMKDDVEKLNNKLNNFFNESTSSNIHEEVDDNY